MLGMMLHEDKGHGRGQLAQEHTMNAVDSIKPKFISWTAACRGFARLDNMAAAGEQVRCSNSVYYTAMCPLLMNSASSRIMRLKFGIAVSSR